jgi:transcriptional regulator with XRE-family HTH domain
MTPKKPDKTNIARLNRYIEALCGIYSRVARRLGVDRSYVSRVAKGERHSEEIEQALTTEFKEIQENEA